MSISMDEYIVRYWMKHFVRDGMCSLCGNVGMIDTRATARTAVGYYCGDVSYCICPNGQQLRIVFPDCKAVDTMTDYQERVNGRAR